MRKTTLLTFILTSLCILLTACGFHLRGDEPLPPQLTKIYLTTNSQKTYDTFMLQLRKSLVDRKIQLVNSPDQALVTLRINSNNLNTSQLSLSASEQIRTYQVSYVVNYSLQKASGEPIIAAKTASARENITLLPDKLIDNTPQLQTAEQNLIQQVIMQIFLGLDSIQVREALQKLSSPTTKPVTRQATHEN